MSLRMRHYEYGDLVDFEEREGDYLNYDPSYAATDDTFSLINEKNQVVAVMGLVVIHDGVAGVWAVISDKARGNGVAVTRYAKLLLRRWINYHMLHRIQALVRCDSKEYQRWITMLGFEHESTMRKVTPDKRDMECYVLLR